jgi:hypothetical protein
MGRGMNSRIDRLKGWERNREKGGKGIKEQNNMSVGTVLTRKRENREEADDSTAYPRFNGLMGGGDVRYYLMSVK